jgi:hypothetical protein
MIVPEQEQADDDSNQVDRDVRRRTGPPLHKGLVVLVRDRVGERDRARERERIADRGPQRPPPQHRQGAERDGVDELAQNRVPHPEPAIEVGLCRENEDQRHQGKRRRGAPCGAGDGSHWTHSRRVQPLAR